MTITRIIRQTSSGLIVGVGAVIYSLSYGALLFSGPLAPFVGYGITIALITATFGALFGLLSEEKSFISGPDSNTISVQASLFAVMGAASGALSLDLAVATLFLTTAIAAVVFLVVGQGRMSAVARYIPFSVTAGFLVSSGWLMSSGALGIISGTPLTMRGLNIFLAAPDRPELAVGVLVAATLLLFARRVSNAVLIPVVMLAASFGVHLFLASGHCVGDHCTADTWFFSSAHALEWLPPWQIELKLEDIDRLVDSLPQMLVVIFVGVLTILLNLASLELSFQKEFDLNRMLRSHALTAGLSAALGGYLGIIVIGRTTLNRQVGGGALSGVIAAAMCLATLLGAGGAILTIPKAALGGLILYLGVSLLKQWLWDQRRSTSRDEYLQIFLILGLVANYGFMTGFAAGLLISCVLFVVTYSRIPLANLATNLSLFASSVVRPEQETEVLRRHGDKTLLYRLSGYVFFGSASRIEAVFKGLSDDIEAAIIDFTSVSGVDGSAVSVFRRILRRYRGSTTQFDFVFSPRTETAVKSFAPDDGAGLQIRYFPSLDHAVESAEEAIIARWGRPGAHAACFAFLESAHDQRIFQNHCELRQIRTGERLCQDGELSDEVFFVENGTLEVIKANQSENDLRLAKLRQGAMVGELAFYTGEARTASIVASTDSSIYVLHKDALARLRSAYPDIATRFDHMVIRKVADSLTRTSKLVTMFR